MGRVLAIDYGGVRTGMARSDELQISVNPLPTIATNQLDEKLKYFLDKGEITDVVFGYPVHKDGSPTQIGVKVEKLKSQYSKKYPKINFHLIDESFTSVKAKEMMLFLGTKKKKRRDKGSVDQMSAVLILKDFLDRI